MKGLFTLYKSDYVKALVTAFFSAAIVALYNVVIVSGFDVFTADWSMIFKSMVNAGFLTLVSYLVKNWLTSSDGKLLGKMSLEDPEKKG